MGITREFAHNLKGVNRCSHRHIGMAEFPEDSIFQITITFPFTAPPAVQGDGHGSGNDRIHAGEIFQVDGFPEAGRALKSRRKPIGIGWNLLRVETEKAFSKTGCGHEDNYPALQGDFTNLSLGAIGIDFQDPRGIPGGY